MYWKMFIDGFFAGILAFIIQTYGISQGFTVDTMLIVSVIVFLDIYKRMNKLKWGKNE